MFALVFALTILPSCPFSSDIVLLSSPTVSLSCDLTSSVVAGLISSQGGALYGSSDTVIDSSLVSLSEPFICLVNTFGLSTSILEWFSPCSPLLV